MFDHLQLFEGSDLILIFIGNNQSILTLFEIAYHKFSLRFILNCIFICKNYINTLFPPLLEYHSKYLMI